MNSFFICFIAHWFIPMTPGDVQKINELKSKKIHMLQVMIIIFTVCFKYNLCFSLIVSLVLVNC